MSAMAPITDANPTVEEMEARVARFRNLRPTADYVDSGIPGCERTTWRVLETPRMRRLPRSIFTSTSCAARRANARRCTTT
ncbi:MAG: hypothetical protein RML56_07080 [Burkholderiales bacterium]|nr:hypothetical protein [Burkholderiales bacterium]